LRVARQIKLFLWITGGLLKALRQRLFSDRRKQRAAKSFWGAFFTTDALRR